MQKSFFITADDFCINTEIVGCFLYKRSIRKNIERDEMFYVDDRGLF